MQPPPEYRERVVAFVDILGFGALVSALPQNPELHRRLHYALTYIKAYGQSAREGNTAHSRLQTSLFSDSIAISSDPSDVFKVIWACGWLHAQLLYTGILTRGGIAMGKTIHEDGVLYGEGMLRAYGLESRAAVYPRVVLDSALLPHLSTAIKSKFLDLDADGLWLVDPFKFDAMPGDAAELASDGHDPRQIYFQELGRHIARAVNEAKQVDHIAKWNWLASRYKVAAEKY